MFISKKIGKKNTKLNISRNFKGVENKFLIVDMLQDRQYTEIAL